MITLHQKTILYPNKPIKKFKDLKNVKYKIIRNGKQIETTSSLLNSVIPIQKSFVTLESKSKLYGDENTVSAKRLRKVKFLCLISNIDQAKS